MIRSGWLALSVVLLATPPATAQEWQQAEPGYPWEFPNDHWAHVGYRTEWWYFVGFADTADGSRRFAWQFTLFRTGLTLGAPPAAPSPWEMGYVAMGHAAVADLATGERVFTQAIHREVPGLARFGTHPDPEIAWMRGPPGTADPWFLTYRDGGFRFGAADNQRGLRMELSALPTQVPWLHGEGGHSPKSEDRSASFYYGHPRLEVTGSLELGDTSVEIAGSGWMDREFGSTWLGADQSGWDWFGLNLGDGRDLMLYLLRRRDGSLSYTDGTLRDADGGVSRRVRGAEVDVLDTWMPPDLASDDEGTRPYPAGWRIRVPGENVDLIVRPLLPNQENRRPAGQAGPDIPYWEGAVRVEPAGSGSAGSSPGRGFVELTGYRSDVVFAGLAPDTIGNSPDAPEGRQDTMMEGLMDGITFVFRWLHVFVGIIWIGHLYFFNFVNGQMTAKLDGATKQKVVPELMPRALYWFRWGAAWTWITGVVLLLLVFWHGGLMFDPGDGWGGGAIAMVLITFAAVFVYDALWNSGLKSNVRAATIVSFLLLAVAVFLFVNVGAFTPRAVLIHTGAMFGTMMAFNVWFRIWPAQQRIIAAVKAGEAPAAADPALAGLRSRHNTYMSLPLLWAMANEHATPFFGGNFGIPGDYYWLAWLVIVAIAWHVIFQCYRIAGRVSGM